MFAPAIPEVMQEFGSTRDDLASFVVLVYDLGYAFGPLVIAPMTELYGGYKRSSCSGQNLVQMRS